MKKVKFAILTTAVLLIACTSFYYVKMKRTSAITPPDGIPYIIILGAKVDGETLSKVLKNRADAALSYWNNNKQSKIIVSGGKGEGEKISEAAALKNYLLEKKVPEDRILLEDTSTSTIENLQNSKDLYDIKEVTIATSDFHLFRAITIAEKIGIKAHPLAAKTPNSVKVSLTLRELLAIGKMKVLGY
ncbi:YdcF family protein [Niallia circulans]|uniref:YdcF family protein n=1 Tax=Niallia circulans TaxID=1397 RepID=A0A553SLI3_NIACI|nr:YdcF family protein [Niallia circulans]TRZ37854.1 YdcF family protein [Niallia circulans]